PPFGSLTLEAQACAVFRAGRDGDRQPLLHAHLARPVAGGARLRRHPSAAPAHGTRPRDGEPALTERDGAPPLTLGARGERRPRRASRPAARRADLRERERDRHAAAERGDAERDRYGGLDLILALRGGAATAPPENRREQISEPAERAQIGQVELGSTPRR